MGTVQIVLVLIGLATVVAVAARKINVPAPSLLVVAGLAVGLLPGAPAVHLTPEIVSLIVLPPLVYAAGEDLSFRDLRRVWRPVTILAVGLVAASAAAVAAIVVALTPLSWAAGLLLGAVLASTDPVAVSALGRRLSLPPSLQALVQAESLFNDATSLILFRIEVTIAVGSGAFSPTGAGEEFLLLAVGGAVTGVAVAGIIALVRKATDDPIVETVISLVTPYLAFVAAERVGGSGVTAVVVAAIMMGALAPRLTNSAARLQLHAVHATTVFVLESVVFSLIGLQLPTLIREERGSWVVPALAITAVLLAMRAAWVFPLALVKSARRDHTGPVRRRSAAVVSWAGARGVVPLAAALSIPLTTEAGQPLPQRSLILVLAIAVIVISLIVQGFTLAPLVTWARISVPRHDKHQQQRDAWHRLADLGTAHVDDLAATTDLDPDLLEQARRAVRATADLATEDEEGGAGQYRRVRQDILGRQIDELNAMAGRGEVTDRVRRHIQHHLDLETERLRGHR